MSSLLHFSAQIFQSDQFDWAREFAIRKKALGLLLRKCMSFLKVYFISKSTDSQIGYFSEFTANFSSFSECTANFGSFSEFTDNLGSFSELTANLALFPNVLLSVYGFYLTLYFISSFILLCKSLSNALFTG